MADKFFTAPSRVKFAGATKDFTIRWHRQLRNYWLSERYYNAGDKVRSPSVAGLAYQASGSGESGSMEPNWPRAVGVTVLDGSITWTAIAVTGSPAVDTINISAWSQVSPPDGTLTVPSTASTIEEATAWFAGGTSGNTYRIRNVITLTSGLIYQLEFDLEIQ
jgi:hypothetical protein